MHIKDRLYSYFGKNIKNIIRDMDKSYFDNAEEIRIRLGRCIIIKMHSEELFLKNDKTLKKDMIDNNYIPSIEDMKQTIQTMSEYSIYSFEKEIKRGFITLKGGYRAGITGKAIIENEKIITIKNISSINIRIPREIIGFSDKIIKYIYNDKEMLSTMILSKPNCGKTTLLRDIIKNISDNGLNVGLVDERGEIANMHMGIPNLDVGIRTDILDRCDKYDGMLMLLRSMSPNLIAVDEIGTVRDIKAIEKIANSGVGIICTMHSKNLDELIKKDNIKKIISKKIFKRYIELDRECGICFVHKIYDEKFNTIYNKGG